MNFGRHSSILMVALEVFLVHRRPVLGKKVCSGNLSFLVVFWGNSLLRRMHLICTFQFYGYKKVLKLRKSHELNFSFMMRFPLTSVRY